MLELERGVVGWFCEIMYYLIMFMMYKFKIVIEELDMFNKIELFFIIFLLFFEVLSYSLFDIKLIIV